MCVRKCICVCMCVVGMYGCGGEYLFMWVCALNILCMCVMGVYGYVAEYLCMWVIFLWVCVLNLFKWHIKSLMLE